MLPEDKIAEVLEAFDESWWGLALVGLLADLGGSLAGSSQQSNGSDGGRRYNIRHITPRQWGGAVFYFDNLMPASRLVLFCPGDAIDVQRRFKFARAWVDEPTDRSRRGTGDHAGAGP